jgi:hypothetical protein
MEKLSLKISRYVCGMKWLWSVSQCHRETQQKESEELQKSSQDWNNLEHYGYTTFLSVSV